MAAAAEPLAFTEAEKAGAVWNSLHQLQQRKALLEIAQTSNGGKDTDTAPQDNGSNGTYGELRTDLEAAINRLLENYGELLKAHGYPPDE